MHLVFACCLAYLQAGFGIKMQLQALADIVHRHAIALMMRHSSLIRIAEADMQLFARAVDLYADNAAPFQRLYAW